MISLTVAVDENFGIGFKNELLAFIPEDLKYFKSITENKVVVMGYNTYLSLPNRPLPNRVNVVLTRKDIELEGAIVKHSIEEVMELIKTEYKDQEVMIMGGQSIYEQFLPYADRLYVTHIFRKFEADAFFPRIPEEWEITKVSAERLNIEHETPHVFTIYERKK